MIPIDDATVFHGDCLDLLTDLPSNSIDITFTSPPYCIGKKYERSKSVKDFEEFHRKVLPEVVRVTRPGGSICWQVGYHVDDGVLTPLDYLVYSIMSQESSISFRNRVIWSFEHGLHRDQSFSGRHEVVLWFSKGKQPKFNLDAVRVPQKYPGKRHYKGPLKGEFSGNPLGKNPGDVWADIPNVKGKHVEKTQHPCQFPVALPLRFIRALAPKRRKAMVFDPFMGAGSTGVAAILAGQRFLGAEIDPSYVDIALKRIDEALAGEARYRPIEKPILRPTENMAVARKPSHFRG